MGGWLFGRSAGPCPSGFDVLLVPPVHVDPVVQGGRAAGTATDFAGTDGRAQSSRWLATDQRSDRNTSPERQRWRVVRGVAHNAVTNTTTLDVVVSVTNKDEFGTLGLSSPQPQADVDFTSTLSDPDGVVSTAWTWQRSTSRKRPLDGGIGRHPAALRQASTRSNLYATEMAYPSWEEPVRLLDQSLGPPEAHLREVAAALGACLDDNPSRALLVARLEDALSAKTGKQPPRPASPHQVRLLALSDIRGASHTAREADALIRCMIARERIDALRSLRPRLGDQLVRLDCDRPFLIGEVVSVTSIDRFGSVWVAGAGGYPSWPQHLARLPTDGQPPV